MKKPLIKQLTISDIMVALINQQSHQDRTPHLRQYLYKTSKQILVEDESASQLIMIPKFAQEQLTEQQLLVYHLQRGNWKGDHVNNYQSLLQSVDEKRKKIIDSSALTFQKSQMIMKELIDELGQSYRYVFDNRKPLHQLSLHLQRTYLLIGKKLIRIRNVERALDVMRMWGKSNISKILNIRADKITEYADVGQIFNNLDQLVVFLKESKQQLTNFSNLVDLLWQRKKAIIVQIYNNMVTSIINYRNESQYSIKYNQYLYVLDHQLLSGQMDSNIERQSLLIEHKLISLIDTNIHQMYFSLLTQKSVSYNIQMLNQDAYLQFFMEILEEFSHYFNSWHKVTTFHVHNQTQYKEGFIKQRTVVFQKMLQRLSQSLKFSAKFSFICMSKQLLLYQKLYDFMECGEQWMGKCKSRLPNILLQKYRDNMDSFFKINNSQLKNCLLDELAININAEQGLREDEKLFKQNDRVKNKLSLLDDIKLLLAQYAQFKINVTKIQKLFYQKQFLTKQQANSLSFTQQSFSQDLTYFYNRLSTKFGCKLFKNIVQYQLRQHYLPDNTQLYLIFQHLQYLIVVLYKVCLPNSSKKKIQKQLFNETEREQRINLVKNAIAKNQIDEAAMLAINQLRHIFIGRSCFSQLYDFLGGIGSKYDGASITTYINASLYFSDFQKHQNLITQLNQKIIIAFNELYLIIQYLQYSINRKRFYKSPEQSQRKIIQLKNVIPPILVLYFNAYFETSNQKYEKYVLPLFSNLKFQIKKLAADTLVSFKQYRNKLQEVYKAISIQKYTKNTYFHDMLFLRQLQYFYKFIIDLYSRIQKINDNGRQILKSQQFQLTKMVGLDKSYNGGDNWLNVFDMFLECSKERNQRIILEKVEKVVLQFPIQWWKSNLIWIYSDFSSKERKEYLFKLANIYIHKITNLPRI